MVCPVKYLSSTPLEEFRYEKMFSNRSNSPTYPLAHDYIRQGRKSFKSCPFYQGVAELTFCTSTPVLGNAEAKGPPTAIAADMPSTHTKGNYCAIKTRALSTLRTLRGVPRHICITDN